MLRINVTSTVTGYVTGTLPGAVDNTRIQEAFNTVVK